MQESIALWKAMKTNWSMTSVDDGDDCSDPHTIPHGYRSTPVGSSNDRLDTTCPICASDLSSNGETLRAFGVRSEHAVQFGDHVLSLECGHRLHRDCMMQWVNTALEPSCPICRAKTAWRPALDEQSNLRQLMGQSWKTLGSTQQTTILWTWIIAAIVSVTDPIGYLFLSTIIMLVTPPMFYAEMAMFLAWVRKFVVSDATQPGFRILVVIGFATLVTIIVAASETDLMT